MKRIFSILMTAAFVLAFGTAYAGAVSNGITDFSGTSGDVLAIMPGSSDPAPAVPEDGAVTSYNGVTDFSGGSYDLLALRPAAGNDIEGSAAGSLRMDNGPAYNGVTDFTGRSYDVGTIDR